MNYKPLSNDFRKFGFNFKQVFREGDYAIYEQTRAETKQINWETIRIRRHNGFIIGGVSIEPSEVYPSNEKWGDDGFTHTTLKSAQAKIEVMKNYKEQPVVKKNRGRGRPKGSKNKRK